MEVKRLSDLAFSPDSEELLYGVNTIDLAANSYLTEYVISDLTGGDIRTLLEASPHISSAQWSPDGEMVAYLSSDSGENNLWLVDANEGRTSQLTDFQEDISSFRWAPDAKAIAFVMPDPEYTKPVVEDPQDFNRNRLWLLPLDEAHRGGHIVNLTADQEFSVSDWAGHWAYGWSPDSDRIVFAHQDGPGLDSWTAAQLATVDVSTKQVTQVDACNTNWKYFPKYSPDGQWLAFINAPGTFKWSFLWDIKIIPAAGGVPIPLARSKNELPFLWQWAPDSKSVYYIENDRSTYSFYQMPIDGSAPRKILGSPEDLEIPGLNTYLVSSLIDVAQDGKTLAFIGQTYNKPPEVYTTDIHDVALSRISNVNASDIALPVGRTELVQWHSLDNTEVQGLLTYPARYDATQKYPIIVQIHGGPNGVDFNEYLPLIKYFPTAVYAEQNYFVLRVNYRGTLGYGKKFREDLIGNFGISDYQDIVSGVNHVINLELVDPDQLFVLGQSNGGTLTGWIVTQTDMFKAACSIAGETDYISLEGTNGYFQTSWYLGGSFVDHLEKFIERSPIFHVKNVRTPILLQGGLLDDNVPFTQVQEFYRALKRVGVDTRLAGYPNSTHEYYPPQLYLKLLQSCLEWVDEKSNN